MKRSTFFLFSLLSLASGTAQAEHESPVGKLLPPDEQEQLRTEKSITVGVPLVNPYNLPGHLQFRPSGKWLLGAGYDASIITSNNDLDGGYELHPSQHSATAYLQFYPLKQSGFYLGLGAEQRFGTFSVHKVDDNGDREIARGKYDAVYGGPSFGMTWLWSSGVTVGFDLSKRKRFSGKVEFDSPSPDLPATLGGDVQQQVTPDTVLGSFMLGYSF